MMVNPVTPEEESRMSVMPRVSFLRCGLLQPSSRDGVSSMPHVPTWHPDLVLAPWALELGS